MYEERREKFTLKDLLIQVLFVGIFIFLLVWLFPLKSDVKKKFDNLNNSLTTVYDQVFNQNVMAMKEAAITYYTTPRLPQKVGNEVKMTLSEMLEESIVLPFVDKDGKQCDLIDSYVSVTKMDDEYILKVNLKCDDQEEYLLVHLGCYNYCDGDVCEKKEEEKPVTPTQPSTPSKPSKPVVNDTYLYEYVKVTNGKWGEYDAWSDWTQNVITATGYRQVETKQEKVVTYVEKTVTKEVPTYGTKQVKTGTKNEAYEVEVPVYETQTVPNGSHQEAYTAYRTVPVYETKSVPYTEEVTTNETVCKDVPQYKTVYNNGSCIKYGTKVKSVKYTQELDCSNGCKVVSKPNYTYETDYSNCVKYEQVATQVPNGTKNECTTTPKTSTVTKYRTETVKTGTKQEAYTAYRTVNDTKTETVKIGTKTETRYKKVPVYETITYKTGTKTVTETVKEPVESNITKYRSRTREYISGSIDTKWSKSQKDTSLLNAGYTLTGNSKKQ